MQLNFTEEVDDLKNEADRIRSFFAGQRSLLQKAKNWARMSGPQITGWCLIRMVRTMQES